MSETAKESFLDSVARAYVENFNDLSEFCFVFPNKRAGTFFLRSLSQQLGRRVAVAPEIMSIADFAEKVSGLDTATRIDMLFRLFNIYKDNNRRGGNSQDELLEFEAFRSWGEILLSDFSEVDQYDVDAESLFGNVGDYREIASNFLTDEQLEILQKYFGYTPARTDVERFWRNLAPTEGGRTDLKERFIYLWQQMAPLYEALSRSLEADGLATPGGVYRHALERVRTAHRAALGWRKVVFVGFNALSTTEALLFEEITKAGGFVGDEKERFADFFWDATGPVLESEESDAASFLRLNKRNFPEPEWAAPYLERNRVAQMPPEMRVIASPSNSAQTKIAAECVSKIVEEVGADGIRDARVAVVLPDENLLLPLLYALPEELGEVNLTMGYSLRLTSVASFLHHLRRLHARSRQSDEGTTFFHEDLRMVLSHPFAHALLGSRNVSKLNTEMQRGHRLTVSVAELRRLTDDRVAVLDMAGYGEGTAAAVNYIDYVLTSIDAALAEERGGVVKSRIDRSHIALYREALRRLERSAREHRIEMGLQGVFYMVDKLLAGEHVTFEGEPLEGLQVMGLLETRAIDFDHLVILSLNDRVMPRKARRATFIPDSLRRGYGLPYANYQERLFAYYFYRMISRVKSVTMIYDARSGEGMRSGGESRYLMQLRYLYARQGIRYENYRFLLADAGSEAREVEKTSAVMDKIRQFAVEGSRRNFSASALRKYGECQVKFYYEVVANLRTDTDESEFIDPITQGNIVHDTMLRLYFPDESQRIFLKDRIRVTAESIDRLLEDGERLRRELRRAVNQHHFHRKEEALDTPVEGAAAMVARQLESQIRDILKYDRTLTPFELAGGEMTGLHRWEYAPGQCVNMKYAIDRLDVLHPGEAAEQWRIVDYKTGASLVAAEEFDDVFNGSSSAKNLFQLLLYANLMNRDLGRDEDVKVSIYEVGRIAASGETTPTVGKDKIAGHKQVNEEFLNRLNGMIAEIFDPMTPFRPTDDEGHCRFCHLQDLCGRNC